MPVLSACRRCGAPTSLGVYCTTCVGAVNIARAKTWRPGRGTKADKELTQAVIRRDNGICWICGQPGATVKDHVIPYAKGGATELWNLRAAHKLCNEQRGARD